MDETNISFVIPCYNGAKVIERSLRSLIGYCAEHHDTLGHVEILVVDDGSTDGSAGVVREQFPEVTIVQLESNQGKGAAVRRGMLEAKGRYRFFVDADMPYNLSALPVMMRYLDFKEFDMVIGARDPLQIKPLVKRTWLRRVSSVVFTELVGRVVITGCRDTQCGFKGFRAGIAEYLFAEGRVTGFAFDVELMYLAYKNNFDVKRVPVQLVAEHHTTVSVVRHALPMLLDIFALPVRYYSNRYHMMPGRWPDPEG